MPQSTPLRRSDGLKTAGMLSATAGTRLQALAQTVFQISAGCVHGEAPARQAGVTYDRLSVRSAMLVIVGLSLLGWASC
jgi:hypothetical protein